MRINAYILAADPAWIEASVLSYYAHVQRIVVSYDSQGRGFTGQPIALEPCLERLRALDTEGKLHYASDALFQSDRHPMENETHQRRFALALASEDADWVLQLDTDEVLADAAEFFACLVEADSEGFQAMDYPARWLYRQLGSDRYLEMCSRFWQITASYPGPVAVRAHTPLRHARQCDVPLFRVDFRPHNTDPWHAPDAPVNRVIRPDQGILHFSMVRSEEQMRRKTRTWGHAPDRDWEAELRHWVWSGKHPALAMLSSLFLRGSQKTNHRSHFRIVHIRTPQPPETDL